MQNLSIYTQQNKESTYMKHKMNMQKHTTGQLVSQETLMTVLCTYLWIIKICIYNIWKSIYFRLQIFLCATKQPNFLKFFLHCCTAQWTFHPKDRLNIVLKTLHSTSYLQNKVLIKIFLNILRQLRH